MLPEQIARMLENKDRERINVKLESALSNDYHYSRSKTEILTLIAEIGELMYRKGRSDERYYNGPMISIYDKEP